MEKKTSGQKPNKLDTTGAKRVVLALAISSTLGFWAIFAKVNHESLVGTGNTVQASGSVPPPPAETQPVLNLPPIPTLIPPLDTSTIGQGLPGEPTQQPVVITQPVKPLTLKPAKILLNGDKGKGKPDVGRPDPIASSRSSK